MRAPLALLASIAALALATQTAHADIAIAKVSVKVAPAKANGDNWDSGFGKEPDPQIDVYVDGTRIQECAPIEDAFEGDCAIRSDHAFGKPIEIELRVVDRDVASDDAIGKASGTVPPDMDGRLDLRVDGKLEKAWVEVEYRDGPGIVATIKKRIGVRSIGALVGILLALLLYRICGARLLSPADVRRTVPPRATVLTKSREEYENADADNDAERKPRETVYTNFWRSPILLASAGASIVGIVLANLLRDPSLPIAVGSLPYVFGGFGFTAPIIDAYKHEHLGGKRLRLVIAGVAAMFAVPIYDFSRDLFTGVSFMAKHLGWTFVGILLLLCLL